MDTTHILIGLIFSPLIILIGFSAYWMIKFMVSRKNSTITNEILVGALGIFSIFTPKLMTKESHKYYKNFIYCGVAFIAYIVALVFLIEVLLKMK